MKPVVKKWMPAAVVPATIAALALGATMSANAEVVLEPKTPEQVLQMVADADVKAFSGEFRTSTSLGIPALPDAGASSSFGPPHGGSPGAESPVDDGGAEDGAAGPELDSRIAELLNLVSGTNEARVFVDGKNKSRLQVMDGMEERNIIRKGASVWIYDSEDNSAVHTTLPDHKGGKSHQNHGGHKSHADIPTTPDQLAERFLDHAGESTDVTVEEGSSVAGRDVYNLVLTPQTDQTLVEDVTIGVDAETGVPLAVTVDAVDQEEPAISAAFTRFTPETPDADLFEFEPPAGATVEEKKAPGGDKQRGKGGQNHKGKGSAEDRAERKANHGAEHRKTLEDAVDGDGWDAVVRVPAEQVPAELTDSALLDQLATEVDGGRLLHTSLVNVLITDDGRVFVGSVPVERLQAAADAE